MPAQDAATGQGAATAEDPVTALHLAAQLEEAREKLDGLVRDLRAVEGELEAMATERMQHRLLQEACGALEELKKTGGEALFWDNKAAAAASDEHMHRVRERVEVFQRRVDEIEERRRGLLAQIDLQQEHTYLLEDDVFEALEEEERRKHEWIIEREIEAITSREPVPAWTRGVEDDRRFRKALAIALLASFLASLTQAGSLPCWQSVSAWSASARPPVRSPVRMARRASSAFARPRTQSCAPGATAAVRSALAAST